MWQTTKIARALAARGREREWGPHKALRAHRGGSFDLRPEYLAAQSLGRYVPEASSADLGFRVACFNPNEKDAP